MMLSLKLFLSLSPLLFSVVSALQEIDTNNVTVTDTNNVTVSDTNNVTVSDTNNVTVSDPDNVIVSDTKNETIHQQEREVLDIIYQTNGGKSWYGNGTTDHCDWDGYVYCDPESRRIKNLVFVDQDMKGNIPTEIAQLEEMSYLSLAFNSFDGNIPTEVGMLGKKLQWLLLNDNELTGNIPSEIGAMTELVAFDLTMNPLTGEIPTQIGMMTNLSYLYLRSNNLIGSIPTEIGMLTEVIILHLEQNFLTNKIPTEVGNMKSIAGLWLRMNELEGQIPSEIGALTALEGVFLQSNNLSASIPAEIGNLVKLREINLSENSLSGQVPTWLGMFTMLEKVILSSNDLTGSFPVELGNLTNVAVIDFSRNNMTGDVSFETFRNMQPMDKLDLGYNNLRFELNSKFLEIMSSTETVSLSGNTIEGALEIPIENEIKFQNLEYLHLDDNCLSGTLPLNLQDYFPRLEELLLSSKDYCNKCFTETDCPYDFKEENHVCTGTRFEFPYGTFLENNTLCVDRLGFYGEFPADYGNLNYLKKLNLSGNVLDGTIPKVIGRTFNILEEFDVSENSFNGVIPSELGLIGSAGNTNGKVIINLKGNKFDSDESIAPINLCLSESFDLHYSNLFCPSDRNVLRKFYDAAKGFEWTLDTNWTDEYQHPCDGWFGVECVNRSVTKLDLRGNDLHGRLISEIGNLAMLKVLDLSVNNMKGNIPPEISHLTNLEEFDLSFNNFKGKVEMDFTNAVNLRRMRIHHTKLDGSITGLVQASKVTRSSSASEKSNFIADCGHPSKFGVPVQCKECAICCSNVKGTCEERFMETTNVIFKLAENSSLLNYVIFIITILLSICFTYLILMITSTERKSLTEIYGNDVFHSVGGDSVYHMILCKKKLSWFIAIVVSILQWCVFAIFYNESLVEFGDMKFSSSWHFRWTCTQDSYDCNRGSTVNIIGWFLMCVLLAFSLVPDIWSGMDLLVSASKIKSLSVSIRCLIASICILSNTIIAIVISFYYNNATATSNVTAITKSVILLFVNRFDENTFNILKTICPKWLEDAIKIESEVTESKKIEEKDEVFKVDDVETEIIELRETNAKMEAKIDSLINGNKVKEESNTDMEAKIDSLINENKSKEELNTNMEAKIDTLINENKSKEESIAKMQADVGKLMVEIGKITN